MRPFAIFTCLLAVASTAAGVAPKASPAAVTPPLTRAAFIATMDGEYRKLDGNRDGVVTRAEVEQKQRRDGLDLAARRARLLFARIDADRNGQISPDEFVKANSVQLKPIDGSATMARLDTNRDQKVSLVEYRILTTAGFDRLDSDRDGILSAAEQRAGGIGK